jgi:hypothetical protein
MMTKKEAEITEQLSLVIYGYHPVHLLLKYWQGMVEMLTRSTCHKIRQFVFPSFLELIFMLIYLLDCFKIWASSTASQSPPSQAN